MRAAHYRGKRDGSIKRYLRETHEGGGSRLPSFRGYEPFQQLWALGVVTPQITSIRLFKGTASDEHYSVIDETHREGVGLKAHSGQPGLHETREILTRTDFDFWEASSLDPRAFRLG